MCGITGIVQLDGQKAPLELLQKMTSCIAHRGPDAEGFKQLGAAALGHRRLSIIDLSGGAQPLCNEDETVWIAFNGEIYNFPELRVELENKGHKFRTHSDTETIVHAYEEWGEECPQKLRGMFAFAIFDSKTQTLFLARDRLGKKPLLYANTGKEFVFASEFQAILAHPECAAPHQLWRIGFISFQPLHARAKQHLSGHQKAAACPFFDAEKWRNKTAPLLVVR